MEEIPAIDLMYDWQATDPRTIPETKDKLILVKTANYKVFPIKMTIYKDAAIDLEGYLLIRSSRRLDNHTIICGEYLESYKPWPKDWVWAF